MIEEIEGSLKNLLKGKLSSLELSFNSFNACYENIDEHINENLTKEDFVSKEEMTRCIENNSLWELRWYPDTPVGYCTICSSNLETLFKYVKEKLL